MKLKTRIEVGWCYYHRSTTAYENILVKYEAHISIYAQLGWKELGSKNVAALMHPTSLSLMNHALGLAKTELDRLESAAKNALKHEGYEITRFAYPLRLPCPKTDAEGTVKDEFLDVVLFSTRRKGESLRLAFARSTSEYLDRLSRSRHLEIGVVMAARKFISPAASVSALARAERCERRKLEKLMPTAAKD